VSEEGIGARKRDHLRHALDGAVGFATLRTGLDTLLVEPRALPERDLADVDLRCTVLGAELAAPLLISCMTGGASETGQVNRALAHAAQVHGVAMGLGSGRALLEDPGALGSFRVRDVAPDVLLLANLGAVQLRTYGAADCRRLLEACEADALVLHLNAVQEAVQAGGDTTFAGLLERIEEVCAALEVPVVVKEVGFGLSPADVRSLVEAGVDAIDVAGAGGTNWARVEGLRDGRAGAVASAFADWGIPTVPALRGARATLDALGAPAVLIASGGVRHGVDALKCLCLGADLVGVARGLLAAGARGPAAAGDAVAVWASGAGTLDALSEEQLIPHGGGRNSPLLGGDPPLPFPEQGRLHHQ
jgi:isopentenyl-diphosphate Delta-isomerase